MGRLMHSLILLGTVLSYLSLSYSQEVPGNGPDSNGLFVSPPVTSQQQQANEVDASTTTTPSPRFTACMTACQTVSHYNPVCGTDGVTYNNEQRLNCARRCGAGVQVLRGGACA